MYIYTFVHWIGCMHEYTWSRGGGCKHRYLVAAGFCFTGACPTTVTVRGLESSVHAAAAMGTYTKVPGAAQGVYQRDGSTGGYLFYWPSTGNWVFGFDYTVNEASIYSSGNAGALCPDQAAGWLVRVPGHGWVSTAAIMVEAMGAPCLLRHACPCHAPLTVRTPLGRHTAATRATCHVEMQVCTQAHRHKVPPLRARH